MDAHLALLPLADIMSAFWLSGAPGQVIAVVLFVGSIVAWSLMLSKLRELSDARTSSDRFLAAYRKESHPVSLYLRRQKYEDSPLYAIYDKGCLALGSALESRGADPNDLFLGAVGSSKHRLSEFQMSLVRNTVERTRADQALLLEKSMGLLATAAIAAPFLGLLGSAWGLMEAFEALAAPGASVTLSDLAMRVAGAFLTTVVGLLVALPSAVGYGLLRDRIRRVTIAMGNYSQELVSHIERQYLQQG